MAGRHGQGHNFSTGREGAEFEEAVGRVFQYKGNSYSEICDGIGGEIAPRGLYFSVPGGTSYVGFCTWRDCTLVERNRPEGGTRGVHRGRRHKRGKELRPSRESIADVAW